MAVSLFIISDAFPMLRKYRKRFLPHLRRKIPFKKLPHMILTAPPEISPAIFKSLNFSQTIITSPSLSIYCWNKTEIFTQKIPKKFRSRIKIILLRIKFYKSVTVFLLRPFLSDLQVCMMKGCPIQTPLRMKRCLYRL